MTSGGYHLFALVRADAAAPAPLPEGLEGGPILLLPAGPAAVVAQDVSSDFVARLQQGAGEETERVWLTDRLLEHERVVESFFTLGPTLPLGFGVLLGDPTILPVAVAMHASALSAFFARAAGRQEWSLKFFVREEAPKRGQMAMAARSGLDYLTARHSVPERAAARESAGLIFVERALARLAPLCEEIISNKSGASPGKGLRLVANLALLIADKDRNALVAEVEALLAPADEEGVELALTGPWPLYSFRPPIAFGGA